MMSRPLRTVLVGFGKVASSYSEDLLTAKYFRYVTHSQVLSDHPAFELLGVVDRSNEALETAREKWGVPHVSDSVKEIARSVDPEVAILAIPPGSRMELIRNLPSLKAILVEKPFGINREAAVRFLNYCKERNILVQVNYWRRGDATFRRFEEGELHSLIGNPQTGVCFYGGGLLNNGSHMIDFARMLFGEIEAVQSFGRGRRKYVGPIAGDTNISFMLQTVTGLEITFMPLDFTHYREIALDIWGEAGRLSIMKEGLLLQLFPRTDNRAIEDEHEIASDRPRQLESTVGKAFYHMYSNLSEAIHGREALWSSGDSAVVTAAIVQAVLDSARKRGVFISLLSSTRGDDLGCI